MKRKIILFLFCAGVMTFFPSATLFAQGTAFTYQGRLSNDGSPANGNYDFQFTIYNALTNGNPVSNALTNSPTAVSNGLFTVNLDFGSGIFSGPARWLDIGVRTNGSTSAFTVLAPRQLLTPTPYAIFANSASNLLGSLATTQLNGTLSQSAFTGYTNTIVLTNSGNFFGGSFSGTFTGSFSGTFAGNGSGLTNLNASNLASGTVADVRLSSNVPLLNTNQAFTGSNTFTGANAFTNLGNSFKGSFFGNGLVGWIPTNATQVQAVFDTGYLLTNSQLVTVTLPASTNINVGDIVRISGAGAGGWQVALNTNQSVIGNFSSFARSYWTLSDASTPQWRSIASSWDGSHLVAVANGSSGGIYASIDSGLHWLGSYASGGWNAVASSANGTKLVAGSDGGRISTNSGTSWTPVGSGAPATADWSGVASSADGINLVAAADGDSIYTSINSGGTWTQRDSSRNWSSVASSSSGVNLVAVVNPGYIYTSINSGGTWTQRDSSRNWSSVASSSDGVNLVAAVNPGYIYTSTNSGVSWTQHASSQIWYSIASSSDGSKLAAVVYGGGIYTSSNFGVTWVQQTNALTKNWSSITSSADGTKLAAAVNGGGIYVSQASSQTTTTVGTNGYLAGSQGSAVELQYIGNGQFMPVSSAGTIWAY